MESEDSSVALVSPTDEDRRASLHTGSLSRSSKMTFYDAFTLLVSLQVGSGIFSSPSQVNNHSPSPGASLFIWTLCGAIAWAGAASFAELGAAMPVNGGMQEYLHDIYGPFMAFLASWIWIFAVKPSSMAILSIIFAKYWTQVFVTADHQDAFWLNKFIALAGLGTIIFFNSISIRATSNLAMVFLSLKLFTVFLLLACCFLSVVFGLHLGTGEPSRDWKTRDWFEARGKGVDHSTIDWNAAGGWAKIGELTMALYAGLWAYSGWDNANMVAGEMQDAAKELPAAIHTAVPAVIVCFLSANLSYYVLIPWSEVGASDTVAETAGQHTLGTPGAVVFALLVSAACLGSININVFTAARLTLSAVHKGYLPRSLANEWDSYREDTASQAEQRAERVHRIGRRGSNFLGRLLGVFGEGPFWQTPIKSMLFNGCITSLYILAGTFGALVTFIGIAEYVFFFFTILGLLLLRIKRPLLPRPYRPFVGIPVLFTIVSFALVIRGVIAAPVQGIMIVVLLLIGVAWHFRDDYHLGTLWGGVQYERVLT